MKGQIVIVRVGWSKHFLVHWQVDEMCVDFDGYCHEHHHEMCQHC